MSPLFTPRREGEEFHEDQILSKAVKAGRRTYFFDVRATRGDDYFLTITESRKTVDAEGRTTYDRHKIFLYKEDFDKFVHGLSETLDYIRSHRPMPGTRTAGMTPARSGPMPFRDGSRRDVPEPDIGTADRRCRKNKRARGPQKLPDTRRRIPVFLSPAAACRRCFPSSFRTAVPTLVRASVPGRPYRSGRSPARPLGCPGNDLFFRINFGIAACIRYLCNQLI